MMKNKLITICFIFVIFIPTALFAFTVNCTVTRVLDGDTFHCQPDSPVPAKIHKDRTITVRMRGIDAPEKTQAYGEEARDHLREMIGRKTVVLKVMDVDRYGRAVSYVWSGQLNVNLEQVKRGYAWAYTEYLDRLHASEFYEAEKQARDRKLGLWSQPNPMPPWEYRAKRR